MIESWKTDMEISRIVNQNWISPGAREKEIRELHERYRPCLSTNHMNAIEHKYRSVKKWWARISIPSPNEQVEAADQDCIPDCDCRKCRRMTLKTKLVMLARSYAGDPSNEYKPGHESRLIAVAEACAAKCLPNELTLTVLAWVEPIDMYRHLFRGPEQWRYTTQEDEDRMQAEEAAKKAEEAALAKGKEAEEEVGLE